MKPKSNKIQIASFDDTTVVGINTTLVDYKLAWGINNKLALDLARYDDLVFEGAPFSFFYYTAGENYNVYNLVSLVCKEKVLFPFKPRLDYLFLIQNTLTAERQINIMRGLREIEGVVAACARLRASCMPSSWKKTKTCVWYLRPLLTVSNRW